MAYLTRVLVVIFFCSVSAEIKDSFHEELFLKTLQSGHLYSHFQFLTNSTRSTYQLQQDKHYDLFPKVIDELVTEYYIQELHLSLTQGLWRTNKWGYPLHSASPGAELWVWFQPDATNVDTLWNGLINALAGLFCTSLNFMDSKAAVRPEMSFRPEGPVIPAYAKAARHIRYASLPREVVCTENLTPWRKILPCISQAGLGRLFRAVKLFDTSYNSLSIHVKPVCLDAKCSTVATELKQTLSAVFDRVTDSGGKRNWDLKKVFGEVLRGACPMASSSKLYVDLTHNVSTGQFQLIPKPTRIVRGPTLKLAEFDLKAISSNLNLAAKFQSVQLTSDARPQFLAHRFVTGYGQSRGGVALHLINNGDTPLDVVVMESVPWFIRVYYHTISFKLNEENIKPTKLLYTAGRDRERSYLIEYSLTLPANSITKETFQFKKALLKWFEYPPDAHHGFYINSAVISCYITDFKNGVPIPVPYSNVVSTAAKHSKFFVRVHTESLMVNLPTPDFSMPFNVICLACTVVAIGFGSIHNSTTKRWGLVDPNAKGKISALKDYVKRLFKSKPSTSANIETASPVDDSKEKSE